MMTAELKEIAKWHWQQGMNGVVSSVSATVRLCRGGRGRGLVGIMWLYIGRSTVLDCTRTRFV